MAKPEIILVAKYSGGKTSLKYLITPPAHNQLYMCRGKKKKIFSSCFNNIIPTLTLPLTLRCLFSFSDVEHSRSGQWEVGAQGPVLKT